MRVLIVLTVVAVIVIGRRLYFQWRRRLANDHAQLPRVPHALLGDADRTWVVFTTPWCASCEPITIDLREADPDAHVVTVDATKEPALAGSFHIRSAPTVLLADDSGEVKARFVDATSVHEYVRQASKRPNPPR